MATLFYRLTAALCLAATAGMAQAAAPVTLCVYDPVGATGDIMATARDYALNARSWGVNVTPRAYRSVVAAQADFDNKACNGLLADNYTTRKYNKFMGTVGAIGAIQSYPLAQKVIQALGNPRLATRFESDNYVVAGYMPLGLSYLVNRDRTLNSLQDVSGKRIGVLDSDPSQRRMAQRIGMIPVVMTIDNSVQLFRRGEIDLVPIALILYQPFEIGRVIGNKGGVANYPMSLVTLNLILTQGDYPADFSQKSRQWFSQRAPQFFRLIQRWESGVPAANFYQIADNQQSSYNLLLSQLRKEFIANRQYDPAMMALITHIRCQDTPTHMDCKK